MRSDSRLNMPAINLARLKIQAARLSEKFMEPDVFLHDLNEMLDLYTNRTIRISQEVRHSSVKTYHTPRPVLNQIESELAIKAEEHPSDALTLVKALWRDNTLESCLLAAFLLGNLPIDMAFTTLTNLPGWLSQTKERTIRNALLTSALMRLRRERSEDFYNLLEDWLSSQLPEYQVWGLQALIPLLQDPLFENLPTVFRILYPAIQNADPLIQLDLQACLAAMEHVSLTETVAYLREIIRNNPRPGIVRLFRRILPNLSPEMQEALRASLREKDKKAATGIPG